MRVWKKVEEAKGAKSDLDFRKIYKFPKHLYILVYTICIYIIEMLNNLHVQIREIIFTLRS